MSYLRTAIVLATCLLIGLCLLFPAGYMNESWDNGHMWFPATGKSLTETGGEYFVIMWQWMAIEIVFFVLGAGVVFTGTYLQRRQARLFIGRSLFLSALLGLCVHLLYWLPLPYTWHLRNWLSVFEIYRNWLPVPKIDYQALLWVDISLLIGLLTGILLLRKQRRPRRLKLVSL